MMFDDLYMFLSRQPLLSQVDISTMLEEAVQYVKFLQLQIKVKKILVLVN